MSAALPSGVVTLPRYLSTPKRQYVTTTGGKWCGTTVALVLALVARIHGTPEAIKSAAGRMVDKVPRESQPDMKRIWREASLAQAEAFTVTHVNAACDGDGIRPDVRFEWPRPPIELVEPPRCHFKPMRLAGYHKHRHWKCQHCSHTKPLDWDKPKEATAC